MSQISQTLNAAAKLIDKYGHVKGDSGSRQIGFCAIGAICEAADRDFDIEQPAYLAFCTWLCSKVGKPNQQVATWNDEQTGAEVVAALRECAESYK